MQRVERFFERGVAPVAVVVFLGALALGAFTIDSRIATSRQAQLAQAPKGTTNIPTTSQGKPANVCINYDRFKITIKKDNSDPVLTPTAPKNPSPQPPEKDKPGCFVQFCAPRTPTAANMNTEECTEPRFFDSDDGIKDSAGTNALATRMFADQLILDRTNAEAGQTPGVLPALDLSPAQSRVIFDAFNAEQAQATAAYVAAQQEEGALTRLVYACQEDPSTSEDNCAGLSEAEARAAERRAVQKQHLDLLQAQYRSLGESQQGLTQSSPPGVTNPPPCTSLEPDCQDYNSRPDPRNTGTTFSSGGPREAPRDASNPPPRDCSGLLGLFRSGCGNGGDIFGGGGQQQQCGYHNGQYICVQSQQQCSPIQQALSGCRNPFTGQQQCGGLMLMLNKCPAGSYNPNNPSNPYNYPQPTCSIRATPTNATAAGQPVTLQWQSQNASYAYLSNSGQIGPSGSMTVYPQGPTTYVMTAVGYGNQQGRCETQVGIGNQSGSGQVKAELSCQPQIADVGMQVAISFACQNANTSGGTGFSTGGALSGTTTAIVAAPSLGSHTTSFGLLCSNQGVTNSAQCTVNVNKAAIVLVANPKSIASGKEANIGWITSGMESCVVSSSNAAFTAANASSTNVSGSAKTPALTQTSSFFLTCATKTGATKTASTTVTVTN